jgi:hypothetical protein
MIDGAVVLDRALADAEVGGNVLAGLAGEHPVHHLALSRRQTREVGRRRLPPFLQLVRVLRQFERPLDAGDQFVAADRLLDEIQRARLHRLDRHRHVAVAGDHDRGQVMAVVVEFLQQLEPAHSRQIGVDQQAGGMAGTKGFEKRLAARIGFDDAAVVFQHRADRLANVIVVVDDEDLGAVGSDRSFNRVNRVRRGRQAASPGVSRSRASALST